MSWAKIVSAVGLAAVVVASACGGSRGTAERVPVEIDWPAAVDAAPIDAGGGDAGEVDESAGGLPGDGGGSCGADPTATSCDKPQPK